MIITLIIEGQPESLIHKVSKVYKLENHAPCNMYKKLI